MLELSFSNTQNKQIPANIHNHNKSDKNHIADERTNHLPGRGRQTEEVQTKLKDHVNLHDNSFTPPLTYSSSTTINGEEGARYKLLQGLVANLLKEQFIEIEIVIGDGQDSKINIAELSQGEAQKLVADDGYFGTEQVAERIFQLATATAGGDPARVDAVREGVEKGFQEALDAFDGWLPDISYKTYDAVMAKLDNWAVETKTK